MLRVVLVCLVALLAAPVSRVEADAADRLFADFDAGPLSEAERRVLQTALTLEGDYRGPLDGLWGSDSRAALDAYAARGFADRPRDLHVGLLTADYLAAVARDGWRITDLPDLGISLALPSAALGPPQVSGGDRRWWSPDGTLSILTRRQSPREAEVWHAAGLELHANSVALRTQRWPDRMITAGILADGRSFFARSDRLATHWSTVYLVGDADRSADLALIAASVRPGLALSLDVPAGGALVGVLDQTRAVLARLAPEAGMPIAVPPAATVALPPAGAWNQDVAPQATGTGFFLGARILMTAAHVVAECTEVTLENGRPLRLLAADAELDVAVLAAPEPVGAWLRLAADRPVRLGQRVHAAGFPYYSLAGTSLHLTGGNVSALAGMDDDRRFFSFTAPVQPGNSGGPLIDGAGGVMGLVTARLSESYIADSTGTLPQNMNYALSNLELGAFLQRNAIVPSPGGLGGFDMDGGAPADIATAIVPIVCR